MNFEKISIKISKNDLNVQFEPELMEIRTIPIEMILDFDEFGKILGLEIISLKAVLGDVDLQSVINKKKIDSPDFHCSYDEECDCFSLQLSKGRSINQKEVDGTVSLDSHNRVVALNAKFD